MYSLPDGLANVGLASAKKEVGITLRPHLSSEIGVSQKHRVNDEDFPERRLVKSKR